MGLVYSDCKGFEVSVAVSELFEELSVLSFLLMAVSSLILASAFLSRLKSDSLRVKVVSRMTIACWRNLFSLIEKLCVDLRRHMLNIEHRSLNPSIKDLVLVELLMYRFVGRQVLMIFLQVLYLWPFITALSLKKLYRSLILFSVFSSAIWVNIECIFFLFPF